MVSFEEYVSHLYHNTNHFILLCLLVGMVILFTIILCVVCWRSRRRRPGRYHSISYTIPINKSCRTYSYRPPKVIPSEKQRENTPDPSKSSVELSPLSPLLSSITIATDSSFYDGISNPTDIDIPFTDLDQESSTYPYPEDTVNIQSIQTSLPLHTVLSVVNDVGLSDEITDRLEELGAADLSDREQVIKSVQMDKANDPMTVQATHSILEDIERQKSRISKTAPISLSKSMKSRVNLHFDGVDKMKLSRSRTNTNSHQKWQISLNEEFSKLISPFIQSKNSLQEQCLDVDPQCMDRIAESGDIRSCPCIARMYAVLQIYKNYQQEICKEMSGVFGHFHFYHWFQVN